MEREQGERKREIEREKNTILNLHTKCILIKLFKSSIMLILIQLEREKKN